MVTLKIVAELLVLILKATDVILFMMIVPIVITQHTNMKVGFAVKLPISLRDSADAMAIQVIALIRKAIGAPQSELATAQFGQIKLNLLVIMVLLI